VLNTRPNQLGQQAQQYFSIPQVDPNYTSAAIYPADGPYVYAKLVANWK
jgi:iron complex outermembrane receptor protein